MLGPTYLVEDDVEAQEIFRNASNSSAKVD